MIRKSGSIKKRGDFRDFTKFRYWVGGGCTPESPRLALVAGKIGSMPKPPAP